LEGLTGASTVFGFFHIQGFAEDASGAVIMRSRATQVRLTRWAEPEMMKISSPLTRGS